MNIRGLSLLFLLSSVLLTMLYLYLFAEPLHLKRLEEERVANIQKVSMKDYPRNRDRSTLKRTVAEANEEIQKLSKKRAIHFKEGSVSIDNNDTLQLNETKVSLKKFIEIFNNIEEDFVIIIATHTDKSGSSQKNLKISQERADRLKEYIRERVQVTLITAIGYGEEFPLSKKDKSLSNRRVEINLRRIQK